MIWRAVYFWMNKKGLNLLLCSRKHFLYCCILWPKYYCKICPSTNNTNREIFKIHPANLHTLPPPPPPRDFSIILTQFQIHIFYLWVRSHKRFLQITEAWVVADQLLTQPAAFTPVTGKVLPTPCFVHRVNAKTPVLETELKSPLLCTH